METNGFFRRRFFKRAAIATLVGGLTAGAGLAAWAHGGGGHRGWHGGGEGFSEERIERMVKHFGVEVDATPEQRAKLTEIATAAAKDLQPLREKVRAARRRGMELLAAPTIDRGAIEPLRAEQIQAADAASKRLTQALADVAEVLTPEQRKQLAERMQKRHERHHGGRRG
jgi:Spy/CpxP family protein refolding chaperone